MTTEGSNRNPLYIDYYSHTKCDCYKIDLPWTRYRTHTIVLCDVAEDLEHAKQLARCALTKHLEAALAEPVPK